MKDIILYFCAAPFFIGFILMIGVGIASCFSSPKKQELL